MTKREFLKDTANSVILVMSRLTVLFFAAIGISYYVPPYLTYLATRYSNPFISSILSLGLVLGLIGAVLFSFVYTKVFE
jgi:hypothetical protein